MKLILKLNHNKLGKKIWDGLFRRLVAGVGK